MNIAHIRTDTSHLIQELKTYQLDCYFISKIFYGSQTSKEICYISLCGSGVRAVMLSTGLTLLRGGFHFLRAAAGSRGSGILAQAYEVWNICK